jgi:glycosyltransferase involved in cell wall biosynthesis
MEVSRPVDVVSTVVVTTYNDHLRLALTMQGFYNQVGCQPFETIVVSDGEAVNEAPISKLIATGTPEGWPYRARWYYLGPESSDFRLAQARNMGIMHALGQQLIICDCDTVPAPNFVAEHQRSLDSVNVGLRKRISIENSERLCFSRKLPPYDELQKFVYSDDERVVGMRSHEWRAFLANMTLDPWRLCWGCNFSCPVEWARHIGGFDESFVGWGGEDEDFAHRLYRMHVPFKPLPDCYVYHLDHHKRTTQSASEVYYRKMNDSVVRNGGRLPNLGLSDG